MNLLNFFFPRKYKFPDSKYNKNISVLTYLNSSTLIVDGLVESGDVMTHVWKKGIKSLLPQNFKPVKVLLLGLAGGSNARLINRYFPKANITAVDIDPVMIDLGKKFFRLEKIKNLKIIITDALEFVRDLDDNEMFGLILVDCFLGKEIPKTLESVSFIKILKKHGRFVLINRLWWMEDKNKTAKFFRSISPHFFFVKAHTVSNVVISLV